jgi:DNA-binding SARP family transcriptional activator
MECVAWSALFGGRGPRGWIPFFLRPARYAITNFSVAGMTTPAINASRAIARPRVVAPRPPLLKLLSGFELRYEDRVLVLRPGAQRLLVFLALQARPVLRQYIAGSLWLESSEERAGANLRSALWRVNRVDERLIVATDSHLQLAADVRVDLRERTTQAHFLLHGQHDWMEADLDESLFCVDLLPDWYDDWLIVERERFHQLRLRVLESTCEHLTATGRYTRALEAAFAAVAGEPLRESAHRALVKVHLAEGNHSEAMRQYDLYRHLLHEQLALAPSRGFTDLIRSSSAPEIEHTV